jgi:hypothetical protein
MVGFIRIPCPKCQHQQSLRPEFLGRRLSCVHCHHDFKLRITIACKRCGKSQLVKLAYIGKEVACDQCGRPFVAEIWVACPQCARELRIRPEYLGHRASCKDCGQFFRATFTNGKVELFPMPGTGVSGATSDSGEQPDSSLRLAAPSDVEDQGSPLASATDDVSGLMPALTATDHGAPKEQQNETAKANNSYLQPHLEASPQQTGLTDPGETIATALAERGQLQVEKETSRLTLVTLETRVKELERSLTEVTLARETIQADFARTLERERDRAKEQSEALKQWQEKCESYLRDKVQLGTALKQAEFERRQEQAKAENAQAGFERERTLLVEQLNQLRGLTAKLQVERDCAAQELDALRSAPVPAGEAQTPDARRNLNEEERLRAELVALKQALQAAAEQEAMTAQQLETFREQIRLKAIKEQEQVLRLQKQQQELEDLRQRIGLAEITANEHALALTEARRRSEAEERRLKVEIDDLTRTNAILRKEQIRLTSALEQAEKAQGALVAQVGDLQTQLDRQGNRITSLLQERDAARTAAKVEQERLSALLAEEENRVRAERQNGQSRLAAALKETDQERKRLRDKLQVLQQEGDALRLERTGYLSQIAELTKETAQLTLQRDEGKALCLDAEQHFRSEIAVLSDALQQARQRMDAQSAELEKQALLHHGLQRDLTTMRQERELAWQNARAAKAELNTLRESFEEERRQLTEESTDLRLQIAKLGDERDALPSSSAASSDASRAVRLVADQLDPHLPVNLARLNEFAERIQLLENEIEGRPASGPKAGWLGRRLAALSAAMRRLWGSPPVVEDDAECNDLEPERRLRALWTEVMSERERALRQAGETCRAELERKLADLRVQLQAAIERADQLEQQTQAAQFSAGTKP